MRDTIVSALSSNWWFHRCFIKFKFITFFYCNTRTNFTCIAWCLKARMHCRLFYLASTSYNTVLAYQQWTCIILNLSRPSSETPVEVRHLHRIWRRIADCTKLLLLWGLWFLFRGGFQQPKLQPKLSSSEGRAPWLLMVIGMDVGLSKKAKDDPTQMLHPNPWGFFTWTSLDPSLSLNAH